MLALAAVLVLMVPALGAASPYLSVAVSGPTQEQLVEGHTVFTVIEVNHTTEVGGASRFAAAVAILVREAKRDDSFRFPGVLWFNDQYLVGPSPARDEIQDFRYPCGGAVMAVNRGDPDPRAALARATVRTPAGTHGASPLSEGTAHDPWVDASVNATGPAPQANASTGVVSPALGTDQTGISYVESYQIMDPNDHNWLIDLYMAYYRVNLPRLAERTYEYPVWAVNVMGSPTFIPDDGVLDCTPFYDTAVTPFLGQPAANVTKHVSCEHLGGGKPVGYYGVDDPCAGYAEPSRNGYCYGGQSAAGGGCGTAAKPLRLYNAVLFFKFEHLRVYGDDRVHNASSNDTNGCHGSAEWACPGGDDDAEGNSHPFHPDPAHKASDNGACGGAGEPECAMRHPTRDIDVYFSPAARPMRPLTPYYAVTDDQGSDAPFHDYDASYTNSH